MKIVKLLILVGVLAGLLVLGWKLVFSDNGGSSSSITSEESELYNQHASAIAEICDVLRSGWNRNRFEEGMNIISGASELTENQRNNLGDSLANGSFRVMDSLICAGYRGAYTTPSSVSRSVVGPSYDGLAVITDTYPNLKYSSRYTTLMNERRAVDDIYNFSVRSMVPTTNISLSLSPEGLVWNLTLADRELYRSTQHQRRRELLETKNSYPELQSMTWLNTALSESNVNERLNQGWSRYIENQRNILSTYLDNLPRDPRLQNNAELRRIVVQNGLHPLRNNLGTLDSRTLRAQVERAAARINQIRDIPAGANHIITQ